MGAAVATINWSGTSWSDPLAIFLSGLLSSSAHPKQRRRTGDRLVSEDHTAAPRETSGASAGGSDGPSETSEFGELFRAYRSDVQRLCRRMLGENAAPDAASEVFLRAQRALTSYDSTRPFRPWLLGIASHHCIDQLRRRTRETRLFDAKDLDDLGLAHPGPSPLRQLAQTEQRHKILTALDALPRKYRLPIVLRYFEELDYQAIAEILGIERPQVGTLLFRAKRQLRTALSDGDGGRERDREGER